MLSAKNVADIPALRDSSTILNVTVKSAKTIAMIKGSSIDLRIKSERASAISKQHLSRELILINTIQQIFPNIYTYLISQQKSQRNPTNFPASAAFATDNKP